MSESTKILGIDPGSHQLGIACISKRGSTTELIFAEVIKAPKKESLYHRLEVIADRLDVLLTQYHAEEVAVEDLFHSQNARSAFHLGIARGVAIAACLRRRIKIFEYAPTQVKSVVTGYGRADKAQVKKMVELTLGGKLDLGFDATDAIAVAICHASIHRLQAIFAREEQLHPRR